MNFLIFCITAFFHMQEGVGMDVTTLLSCKMPVQLQRLSLHPLFLVTFLEGMFFFSYFLNAELEGKRLRTLTI